MDIHVKDDGPYEKGDEGAVSDDLNAPLGDASEGASNTSDMTDSLVSKKNVKHDKKKLKARIDKEVVKQQKERAERSEKRNPTISIIRTGVTALLLVGTVGMGLYTIGTTGSHEDKIAAKDQEISRLKDEKSNLDVRKASFERPEVMINSMTEAQSKAGELSDLQNAMGMVDISDTSEENIKRYTDRVDDARRYLTKDAMTSGTLAPHGQWFRPYVLGKDLNDKVAYVPRLTDTWEWKVLPSKNVSQDGTVPVMWEARSTAGDDSGTLYAWMFADYDVGSGLFHNFVMGITDAGHKFIPVTLDSDSEIQSAEEADRQAKKGRELAREMERERRDRLAEAEANGELDHEPQPGEGVREGSILPENREGSSRPEPAPESAPAPETE